MYRSTSMRVNAVKDRTVRCERAGRWAKAFATSHDCYQPGIGGLEATPLYIIQYGNMGMESDYQASFGWDDLEGMEVAMRNFNDLRGWRVIGCEDE